MKTLRKPVENTQEFDDLYHAFDRVFVDGVFVESKTAKCGAVSTKKRGMIDPPLDKRCPICQALYLYA